MRTVFCMSYVIGLHSGLRFSHYLFHAKNVPWRRGFEDSVMHSFVSSTVVLMQIWERWCIYGSTVQFVTATSGVPLQRPSLWRPIKFCVYLYAWPVILSMEMAIFLVAMMAVRFSVVGVDRVANCSAAIVVPVCFVRSVQDCVWLCCINWVFFTSVSSNSWMWKVASWLHVCYRTWICV